jgi:hypothetical protein
MWISNVPSFPFASSFTNCSVWFYVPVVSNCVHMEGTGTFCTKKSTFSRGRAVMAYKISFLPFRVWVSVVHLFVTLFFNYYFYILFLNMF